MAIVPLSPNDLRDALASNATSLQFQVQVHVPTARLAGVEAFVRWPYPPFGMIGPQEIGRLVVEGGLHHEFDAWVIDAACRQAAEWRRAGVDLPLIAVNVWDQTARGGALLAMVEGTSGLEVELPRDVPIDAELVAELRARGVRVATEGLPAVDVDTIKLRHPVAPAVVEAARSRGMRVVATRIETTEQQAAALAAGCEIVQGYVFGPEVSAAEVSALAR